MKKLFIISVAALALAACGGSTKTDNDAEDTTVTDGTEVMSTDSSVVADTSAADTIAITPEVKKEEPKKEAVKPAPVEKPAPAVAKAGKAKGGELIKASDCLTCHREDMKLVGPAYADVAKKYTATEANINTLADKVIAGGSGNWGQIPMTPHPNVSKSDAKEMVKYILAVK